MLLITLMITDDLDSTRPLPLSLARSEKDYTKASNFIKNDCGRFVRNQNAIAAMLKTKYIKKRARNIPQKCK